MPNDWGGWTVLTWCVWIMFALYVLVMCYVFYMWLRDRRSRNVTLRWLKRQRLQREALERKRDEMFIKIVDEDV